MLRLESMPDQPIQAGFGDGVRLYSVRDMHLFEILNVLRALKPAAFVDEILRKYPAVGAAARVYPHGVDSIAAQRPPAASTSTSTSTPMLFASATPVPTLLDEAHRLYLEDIRANAAPRVFWPSAHAYKLALFRAGQRDGIDGARHLSSIPATDLAILATIELAAGVLGLPMHHGYRQHRPLA